MKRLMSIALCLCFFMPLLASASVAHASEITVSALMSIEDSRTKYTSGGVSKQGGKITHYNIIGEEEGFLDLSVITLSEGAIIKTQLFEMETGIVVLTDTFSSVGTKQFMIPAGVFSIATTFIAADGIGRYALELYMPKQNAPVVDAPVVDAPVVDAPVVDAPVVDAPHDEKPPDVTEDTRTKYITGGVSKQGGKITHYNIISEAEGFADLSVTSLGEGTVITVELIAKKTGIVVLKDTFTSVGTKQFMIPAGVFNIATTTIAANGIGKYALELRLPKQNAPSADVPVENAPAEDVPVESTPVESTPIENVPDDVPDKHESSPRTAFEVVKAMKAGWNLANSLESLDHQKKGINSTFKTMTAEQYYETYWGNPVTTPKMIADIAEMGFGVVRVPVTWQDHMDSNYVISRSWLERVKEVVDYVTTNDMYCIINLHHDTGEGSWPWLKADPTKLDETKKNYQKVWKQIAEFFSDYSDKLLFESLNEILDAKNHWTGSTPECYDVVNQLNQVFVDTVRATGGVNSQRFLVVTPYSASVNSDVLSYYRLPADTIPDHLIASVHTYAPAGFTWHKSMATWTTTYSAWDEAKAKREFGAELVSLRTNLTAKGIPVIITECGAWNKNNTAARCAYADYIVREAAKEQITCFWWDGGGVADIPENVTGSTLYDRYNERWVFPDVAAAFTKAAAEAWAER